MTTTDAFLAHYGVKGMKWGVRKKRAPRPESQMSDAELQRNIQRLNMEKQYRQLTGAEKKRIFDGRTFANSVLQTSSTTLATTVLTGASLYAAKKLIEQRFGPEVAASIFRRKK